MLGFKGKLFAAVGVMGLARLIVVQAVQCPTNQCGVSWDPYVRAFNGLVFFICFRSMHEK
jgi:hypothetical protein